MKQFLHTALLLCACGGAAFAAKAPQITKQPADATFAKAATGRFYVSASSLDTGYLTYQWYQSAKFDNAVADPNGTTGKTTITTASKSTVGKSATLTITTPATAGYYYYWVEITNHKEGQDDTAVVSRIVQAKVVDRTLPDHLTNGNFETAKNAVVAGTTTTTTNFAQNSEFQPWNRMPDWNTTHLAKTNAYNSNGKGPYAGKQLQLFGDHAHILSTPHNNIWVELCYKAN